MASSRGTGSTVPALPERRRATLRDAAALAGVSVSTASKVVRDAPGVSPLMRAGVTTAIEQLGYRPNAGARSMRGRSYTIGVVATDLASPFQPEVVSGVRAGLCDTRFQEILVIGGDTADGYRAAIDALLDRRVDGLRPDRPCPLLGGGGGRSQLGPLTWGSTPTSGPNVVRHQGLEPRTR